MMNEIQSGTFVNIGDPLRMEEQYLGKNDSTYVEDGKVCAAISGILKVNESERTITVENTASTNEIVPKHGDIVTGEVYMIRKSSVGVRIQTLNQKLVMDLGLIGNIHVANVSRSYVDKLDNVFQKTDMIRAKIIAQRGKEYSIATNAPNLGVITSTCKYCGKEMQRKGKGQSICPFCNHYDRKIMANDFGDPVEVLKF
ncbi:exosome complex RNA-binding protein Csl4 [Candidatus Lokiarchaeum ossiferum]|uniref:exosome complex RNA-binding protein Csl4 n=1 Tax=Candidatus Lokiarchaeum ossiferum TaxID=2951803 RepID=UPI00352DB591